MNSQINWKQKLSSRKLWVSVAGLITGIVLLVQGGGSIEGVIMALGAVIAYTVGEGLTDASRGS
jgi:uncharacterized membrane protein YjjP (DUF1212 family)